MYVMTFFDQKVSMPTYIIGQQSLNVGVCLLNNCQMHSNIYEADFSSIILRQSYFLSLFSLMIGNKVDICMPRSNVQLYYI